MNYESLKKAKIISEEKAAEFKAKAQTVREAMLAYRKMEEDYWRELAKEYGQKVPSNSRVDLCEIVGGHVLIEAEVYASDKMESIFHRAVKNDSDYKAALEMN